MATDLDVTLMTEIHTTDRFIPNYLIIWKHVPAIKFSDYWCTLKNSIKYIYFVLYQMFGYKFRFNIGSIMYDTGTIIGHEARLYHKCNDGLGKIEFSIHIDKATRERASKTLGRSYINLEKAGPHWLCGTFVMIYKYIPNKSTHQKENVIQKFKTLDICEK